jgi:hypothetical protein
VPLSAIATRSVATRRPRGASAVGFSSAYAPGREVAADDPLADDLGRQRMPVALTAVDLPGARVEEEPPVEVGRWPGKGRQRRAGGET